MYGDPCQPALQAKDVVAVLEDPIADVSDVAVQALASAIAAGEKDVIDVVTPLQQNGDWRVREAAVQALAPAVKTDKKDVIVVVVAMLKDEDARVRKAAARALVPAIEAKNERTRSSLWWRC